MADSTLQWKLLVGVLCLAVGIDGMAMSFPRMTGKRGKIYFPRLGRGGLDASHQSCCPLGLAKEWSTSGKGRTEVTHNCPPKSECCDGLIEMVGQKLNRDYYLMCVPAISAETREN